MMSTLAVTAAILVGSVIVDSKARHTRADAQMIGPNYVVAVGEAPNALTRRIKRRGLILTGQSGRRLAKLLGVSWNFYLRRIDRVNLAPIWKPQFSQRELRATAEAIKPLLAGKLVVLLGRKVARAFGIPSDPAAPAALFRSGGRRMIGTAMQRAGRQPSCPKATRRNDGRHGGRQWTLS